MSHSFISSRQEIVFILGNIPDIQWLVKDTNPGIEVYILDSQQDSLAQMADILAGRSGVDALHLLSHGSVGEVQLGAVTLTSGNVNDYAGMLAQIGAALSPTGDVLLYGCNVAAGSEGQLLVDTLARLTQADVAASSNLTGAAALGGDWVLGYQSGTVESALPFADGVLAGYGGVMETAVFQSTPANQEVNEDTDFAFTPLSLKMTTAGEYWSATVKIASGSGTLVSGSTSGTTLGATSSQAGINTFLNGLIFRGAENWNGAATISVTVQDYNDNTDIPATFTFGITVNSVLDAPVTGAITALGAVDEGTLSPSGAVISTLLPNYLDADGNTLAGVAISANTLNSSHGAWKYSTDDGLYWYAVGNVSASDGKLLLAATAKLHFVPAGDWFGVPATLTLNAIDNSGSRTWTSGETRWITTLSGTDISASGSTLSTSITAVNDAPTTSDDASLSVNKNATLTFSLASSDVDGGSNTTTDANVTLGGHYNILSIPAYGVLRDSFGVTISVAGTLLTVAQATNMTFTPTTNYSGSDVSFTFEAIDAAGAVSNISTATITVTFINVAPMVTVPGAFSLPEDTAFHVLSGIVIADTDAVSSGDEQVTISASHGNIKFIATTGLTSVTGNNSYSVILQGTLANINTALGSSNLTYSLDADYPNGTVATTDTITVLVSDLDNTDPATTPATASKTITVTVNPVPDKPVVTGAVALGAVNEDTLDPSGVTVTSLMTGHFTDADGNTLAGIAISHDASTSGQGVWQYSVNSGATWSAVGSVSSSDALLLDASSLLRFVPSANWNGTPGSLTIHAIDNSGTNGDNSSRTYTSVAAPVHTDVTSGVTDIDATGSSLSISITPVADPFVIVNDNYLRVDEGATQVLGSSILKITNVEATAANIVYTATGTSFSNGHMELDGDSNGSFETTVINGTTFTQDDIDNNRLRYVHDGAEPGSTDLNLQQKNGHIKKP